MNHMFLAATLAVGSALLAGCVAPQPANNAVTYYYFDPVSLTWTSRPAQSNVYEVAKQGGCLDRTIDVCLRNLQIAYHFNQHETLAYQLQQNNEPDVNGNPRKKGLNISGFIENFEKTFHDVKMLNIEYSLNDIVKSIYLTIPGGLESTQSAASYEDTGIYEGFVILLGADCPDISREKVYRFFENEVKPRLRRDSKQGTIYAEASDIPFCGRRFSYYFDAGHDAFFRSRGNYDGLFSTEQISFR